jgi:hypothetical protein
MAYANGSAAASVPALPAALVVSTPTKEPALTTVQHTNPDVAAFMPAMSIEVALERWTSIQQFIGKIMIEGEDYGTIPGSKKPSLLKPGAEKLTAFFGLVPTFDVTRRTEDWDGEQYGETFFHYEIKCTLSRNGDVRGEGLGSCNSREVKYRYRDGERKCPACQAAAIIKGKEEYGGGWLCFAKKGGCGAKFHDGDTRITGQQLGRVLNPDLADIANTILKMAKKRSHVDAVLNTTGASQFFTQDVEDMPQLVPQPQPTREQAKAAQSEVAARKIEALKAQQPPEKPWTTFGQMLRCFAALREQVGETAYMGVMGSQAPRDIRDTNRAIELYNALLEVARNQEGE